MLKRANVPASATIAIPRRVVANLIVHAPTPPAAGCIDGKKYHRWTEVKSDPHKRTCARGCGAFGWLDHNGQVKRVSP